jgi:hypothetical protein
MRWQQRAAAVLPAGTTQKHYTLGTLNQQFTDILLEKASDFGKSALRTLIHMV